MPTARSFSPRCRRIAAARRGRSRLYECRKRLVPQMGASRFLLTSGVPRATGCALSKGGPATDGRIPKQVSELRTLRYINVTCRYFAPWRITLYLTFSDSHTRPLLKDFDKVPIVIVVREGGRGWRWEIRQIAGK